MPQGATRLNREGVFLAFEGIDGAGTTTQAQLLAARLRSQGHSVVETREPGGTPLGDRIRELVLDPAQDIEPLAEALLYAASRAQHVAALIAPALRDGRMVVSDRYLASSIAYQGDGRGLSATLVKELNAPATALWLPALTFYLDLPVAIARQRRQQRGAPLDRIEAAGEALQEQVAAGYHALLAENPATWVRIPADRPAAVVATMVWDAVSPLLPPPPANRLDAPC